MITSTRNSRQSSTRRRGFTLPELAIAIGLALAIAAIMMTLLQQQVTFHRIIKTQGFLVDDAPQINNTVTQILSRADAYRIHSNLSDAVAGTNAVTADGKLHWNEEILPLEHIEKRLGEAASKRPQPQVHIRGDRAVEYEHVIRVMASAQTAGIEKLGFITEPSTPE